jgi:hypothetical protein
VVVRLAFGLTIFAALVAFRLGHYVPVSPNPLALLLTLDPGEAGRADPVICAGKTGAGDFLSVRFLDRETIVFAYDSWGRPGIPSQPVTIRPGETLRLLVELPFLRDVEGNIEPVAPRVRIVCNGKEILDTPAHHHVRAAEQIYFGENPLGGTACGTTLRGQLALPTGQLLRGTPATAQTSPERLHEWLSAVPSHAALLLLFAIVVSVFATQLRAAGGAAARFLPRWFQAHPWFCGSAALAIIVYGWLVTFGTFRFNHAEVFGSFYDYQAATLLEGRLDVPEEAIGGEAFEAWGRLYGYFGPTPALLRVPFVVLGLAFGKLSRALALVYFLGSLVAAYLIFLHAMKTCRAAARPRLDLETPSGWATIVLVGSAGLGSTIFFLGSRTYIYHEAILAGIAFALWSVWCSLRHLAAPSGRWWMGALVCGVLSVHSRPPTGLFALTLLGCVSALVIYRDWRAESWRPPPALLRHLAIGVLAVSGFLSLNGLAWLKFGTFDAAPLRISRPYTGTPGRLEHIDGRSFHLANLPFNFDTYVRRPNFRIEPGFPWIYLGAKTPRRDFPHAKIDLPDFTLALPYAMPSLFLLGTLGCLGAVLAFPGTRFAVGLLWLAALPMTLALFAAVATAQRYTGDFCPLLISAGAFGLAALERTSPSWRLLLRALALAATLAAISVTVALTLHYQGQEVWGVPDETRAKYQELRRRVDDFFGVSSNPPATLPPPRTDADF